MEDIMKKAAKFRDDRNWKQFHNPKDLALSLNLEAAELLELFQWKDSEEAIQENISKMKEEIADIFLYAFLLCDRLGLDPKEIIYNKIKINNGKYPVDKAYGSKKKYTEL